jgi:hypothetical protein
MGFISYCVVVAVCTAGLSNAVSVIYLPGPLLYSAGFNVNQDLKKKIFLNKSMFKFFL